MSYQDTPNISFSRSVLVGLGIAVVGYALVAAFGNVVDVQGASNSESFGDAAAAAGNRLRLALLFDLAVFVPGYLLTVWRWSRWRVQSLPSSGRTAAFATPSRSAASACWLYRLAPLLITIAAIADVAENCFVYLGLGTVDLSDAAAAMMVAPPPPLIALLRVAAAAKWLAVAVALLSLIAAGAGELLARRQPRLQKPNEVS